MPLAVRTNGSGGSNIIQAAWFNDIRDLLTGVIQDQEVSIKNNLVLSAIGAAPSVALTGAVVVGAGMGIGAYVYVYTFVSPDGESAISPTTNVTTTSGNQKVNLTAIAVGPTGTTARKVYRTIVGGGTKYKLLTTLADNTTTIFTDTTADGSLGVAPPAAPSFGGSLLIKDATNTTTFQASSDGSVNASYINTTITPITIAGTTAGTVTAYMDFRGTIKRILLYWNNFKNAGTTNTLILPVAFASGAHVSSGDHPGFNVNLAGGTSITNNTQTGMGTNGTNVSVEAWAITEIPAPFDRIAPQTGNVNFHTGWTMIEGN